MCNFGVFFKKLLIIVYICSLFITPLHALPPQTSASSAILINADTNEVICSKNAEQKRGMASTTKIMTAILAIENGNLDSTVSIPDDAIGVEGSSLYLKQGETMTLRDLVYGLMLRSANDAAEAIAITVCGSVDEFAILMNQKADAIGLKDTHFTNPHGLSDDNHFTTAKDLAILASYAMQNNTFREICSSKKAELPGGRIVVNHNKLLSSFDGACGVKTGFTKATGRCLVSAASRNGINLIAVTLNAPDDWRDHTAMLEYGFSEYESITLANKGDVLYSLPIIGGDNMFIPVVADKTLSVCLKKNRGSIVESLHLLRPRFAPVYKGEFLGYAIYKLDGKTIATVPLVASEYVGTRQN